MKQTKDFKSIGLILALLGLILVSGFITSKTLFTEISIENSRQPNVNASPNQSAVNTNSGETDSKAAEPRVGIGEGGTSVGSPDVTVWVNTNSGVYHCPNTRWYGNTKNGEYMTQKEAQAHGYRPAHGAVCG